jgi:hypothetical protein
MPSVLAIDQAAESNRMRAAKARLYAERLRLPIQ